MIEGERHGRLVLLESLGLDDERQSIGRFLCDCGVVCIKQLAPVRSSNTRSAAVYGSVPYASASTSILFANRDAPLAYLIRMTGMPRQFVAEVIE
jgi:hypothetical protein